MNRRTRRAAAKVGRISYQHRLLAALNALDVRPGSIGHITVEHESGCAWELGRCTCTPDITRRVGDRLQRIGVGGDVEKTPLC
jgi:hypothetical protein